FHARLGLARGEEGISDWLWLEAPRVVEESLRDAERGKAVSVPSKRYTAIWTLSQLAPSGLMARLAARGRCRPVMTPATLLASAAPPPPQPRSTEVGWFGFGVVPRDRLVELGRSLLPHKPFYQPKEAAFRCKHLMVSSPFSTTRTSCLPRDYPRCCTSPTELAWRACWLSTCRCPRRVRRSSHAPCWRGCWPARGGAAPCSWTR